MDPWRPLEVFWEDERWELGPTPVMTVLLAGAECRFTCVFCDLWRRTLDGPTPPGAIPAQLRQALRSRDPLPDPGGIKLYNASNFFDRHAVPEEDDAAIASLVEPFARVTVECHPRLIGRRCLDFGARLEGRLEVAIGLETVHPAALARLNKQMRLADFDRAAARLGEAGIALRVFLLVPPPFVPRPENIEWIARAVAYAERAGARHVALVPMRPGNGAVDRLLRTGDIEPASLRFMEDVFDRVLPDARTVVSVDLWDIERLAACGGCRSARVARLRRMNLTGRAEPRIECAGCGSRS